MRHDFSRRGDRRSRRRPPRALHADRGRRHEVSQIPLAPPGGRRRRRRRRRGVHRHGAAVSSISCSRTSPSRPRRTRLTSCGSCSTRTTAIRSPSRSSPRRGSTRTGSQFRRGRPDCWPSSPSRSRSSLSGRRRSLMPRRLVLRRSPGSSVPARRSWSASYRHPLTPPETSRRPARAAAELIGV